ncbi:hypothetical protein Q5P01_023290 [Channa striata]|uniref:Uncharacterized protein n=1 Tax=Channa striata TaxID=64152 RepID=A0AA88ISW4_CHASR|nr:hypothetical protein Q5P01_023290 [Channa striata]
MLHEREQCEEENVSEAESKETIDEESEQEEDIQSVREDSREKDILTKCVASSIDETVLHTAEFTYEEEEEDMAKNSELHRKTREADDVGPAADEKLNVTSAEVSVNDTFFDKDHVEEERLFTETHMSNTLETEAETGQEKSGEFKNISLRMCEGEVVVSRELNSPTCGETREGVPEYNNEPGPDENSTQRFLEVVDCEEIQSTQLPEEVGGKESESLQNSGDSTGADGSLAEERGKEQQESAEDSNEEHSGILDYTQTGSLQETETALIGQEIKESGVSFKEEDGKLLVPSMKTATEQSEKELETRVGSEDECDETTGQQKDGTEELLVEFEADEGFSDLRDDVGHGSETRGAEAAEEANEFTDEPSQFIDDDDHEMADARSFQDSVGTVNLDQHCTMTPSLLEGFIESGLLKPKTTEDGPVDRHSAVIDGEETAYGPEEQATGSETRKENQMGISNLQLVTPLEETDKNESAVWAGSEAFEISNEETVTETEAADEFTADEFKQKDVAVVSPEDVVKHETESEKTYAKDEGSSISGNQDVIDEEILDLWIQVASSQNADDMKQQTGVKIVQSNEENAEISSVQTETNHERESEAEMSSLSAEPGFLEQPVSVWDTQNSPTQPELLQDIYDTLASISESTDTCDISTQQFQSEAQDSLMEEAVRTGQSDLKEEESLAETGFHPDSGVLSSEDRQEKVEGVELVESETQKDTEAAITDLASRTDWKEIKEADFKSPKEEVEETNFEGGAFGVTASHSPNEFKLQSRQSKGALEVLSEEGIVSTESGLQLDTGTESENLLQLPSFEKPQPGWSEGGDESFPEQNRANVEELTTESEGLTEVDASTLDFTAQRSRIAVKNPRVRPPKDARSLLHMPSVEPTPSTKLPVKVPAGVPLGGLGIGIKLPGLGAGFPVLRKTRVEREENSADTAPQKPETKPEDKKDTPKQDEVQHRPKWMPPKQQGFGNPLMSELKSKLKKPTKE